MRPGLESDRSILWLIPGSTSVKLAQMGTLNDGESGLHAP
jgi:hypothetical protein